MVLDCITPKKLILIEPQSGAFAQLKMNFGSLPGIELHNITIGERVSVGAGLTVSFALLLVTLPALLLIITAKRAPLSAIVVAAIV
jgi:hypothetical protein